MIVHAVTRLLLALAVTVSACWAQAVEEPAAAIDKPVAREILALYTRVEAERADYTRLHQVAQMPLNHLGLTLRYRAIEDGLPPLAELDGVRGVIVWFGGTGVLDDPRGFLRWARRVVDSGRDFVLLGELGFLEDKQRNIVPVDEVNRFLRAIGLRYDNRRVGVTYDVTPVMPDPTMVQFERELTGTLPGFPAMAVTDPLAKTYLKLKAGAAPPSHVVVVTSNGGYAASGYELYRHRLEADGKFIRQWRIDPFRFFRQAFHLDDMPAPDTTTRDGRRIFYSHIDGDGWRNVTRIEDYQKARMLSSEVILRDVLKKFPDLPVTVAPIGADLSPDWYGTPETRRIAREIFELPNVELASHTLSHPFEWSFFEAPDNRKREREYFARYPGAKKLLGVLDAPLTTPEAAVNDHKQYDVYARPRAFALEPFSMEAEIEDSRAIIESLAPPGKKMTLLQWSGDCMPFEDAIAETRRRGIANINGGDTRFDPEYPSYAWVAPTGLRVGDEIQIYSSNSNENTYTSDWTDRFFGFRYLERTARNTETPIRVKPLNVYYHMYSGERAAAVNAVISNYLYARNHPFHGLRTSTFARIGEGFYTTKLLRTEDGRWRVETRGALDTIRFDYALFKTVDFDRSTGVLGQRRLHGSLYVALDPAVETPIIALREVDNADWPRQAGRPYLVESQWDVRSLTLGEDRVAFEASGFGRGEMIWAMSAPGRYRVTMSAAGETLAQHTIDSDADGVIAFTAAEDPVGPWITGRVDIIIEGPRPQ